MTLNSNTDWEGEYSLLHSLYTKKCKELKEIEERYLNFIDIINKASIATSSFDTSKGDS